MGVFSKKDKVALDLQTISTLISEGCTIAGNINAPAVVRIDGEVTGDVVVSEGLILGEKGLITGNVITKELIIYGMVAGNIKAQSLEIKHTGKITGDIETATLLVETGGIYNGRLTMATGETKQIKKIA
ncbi:MAG: Polymer-forming cytoskeletal [Mucilaginibacter sp.]|nr:Polymer-forming cytoskeletal [Mucilaginibacter sp.]